MEEIYPLTKSISISLLAISLSCTTWGQSAGNRLAPTDASREKATVMAKSTFSRIIGRVPSMEGAKISWASWSGKWIVYTRDQFEVDVDARTGLPCIYWNNGRRWQQHKTINRTGKPRFRTTAEWKTFLLSEAKRIVPSAYNLEDFTWKGDGPANLADKGSYVAAKVRDRNGKRVCMINVDPQDGTIRIFEWYG